MRHMMMKHSLLSIIILAFYFVCTNHVLADFNHYQVHIISAVPDKPTTLSIHCQSKDNDLGFQNLSNGQAFHWHFRMNFFETTLFFCRFQWNSKDTSFVVFNSELASSCDASEEPYLCVWVVKPDGFYLGGVIDKLSKDDG
ncbi:hypothetical protein ACSBR2_030802 [Camellia fascicularis]